MDEEDGRLGPPSGHIVGKLPMNVTGGRTQQPGHVDVRPNASTKSLRLQTFPEHWVAQVSLLRPGRDIPIPKGSTDKTNLQNEEKA